MSQRARRPGWNGGFTLFEVVVALTLTALVLAIAHALIAGVTDGAGRLAAEAQDRRAAITARAWLLEACHGLAIGTPGDRGFEGTPTEATFSSRLLTERGVVERVPVRIAAIGDRLLLDLPQTHLVVAESTSALALAYLLPSARAGTWLSAWSAPTSAPTAIRIVWQATESTDTLICPIGGRG